MILPRDIRRWPPAWLELYTERAGIKEYQGNLPRLEAERQAEQDIRHQAAGAGGIVEADGVALSFKWNTK